MAKKTPPPTGVKRDPNIVTADQVDVAAVLRDRHNMAEQCLKLGKQATHLASILKRYLEGEDIIEEAKEALYD